MFAENITFVTIEIQYELTKLFCKHAKRENYGVYFEVYLFKISALHIYIYQLYQHYAHAREIFLTDRNCSSPSLCPITETNGKKQKRRFPSCGKPVTGRHAVPVSCMPFMLIILGFLRDSSVETKNYIVTGEFP